MVAGGAPGVGVESGRGGPGNGDVGETALVQAACSAGPSTTAGIGNSEFVCVSSASSMASDAGVTCAGPSGTVHSCARSRCKWSSAL